MALRKASSSEQFIRGLRPCPARVCKPVILSASKRFTQPLTLWAVISVCPPTQTELKPSDLSKTARQRIRKQWLCPLRKPKVNSFRLKSAYGYINIETGKILALHHNSVARYIKLYKEKGMEGLYETRYHRQVIEMGAYKETIVENLTQNPVGSIAQAIDRIKSLTGIERKPTQVRNFMHRHGFKYRKLGAIPGKVNREKQKQFMQEVLNPAIVQAEKSGIELLFCDATHFTLSYGVVSSQDIFKNFSRS
jgi:transposase